MPSIPRRRTSRREGFLRPCPGVGPQRARRRRPDKGTTRPRGSPQSITTGRNPEMSHTDEHTKYLSIYLEDHVAGATAGAHRAARLAEAEAESPDAAALEAFSEDVATDLDALLALMATMGFEPS